MPGHYIIYLYGFTHMTHKWLCLHSTQYMIPLPYNSHSVHMLKVNVCLKYISVTVQIVVWTSQLHQGNREKGSWLNSGPTLYYGVSATQGTNPGWDPTSVPNCLYVPLFFLSPFHSKVWSPCNNLTGCTNSRALAISVTVLMFLLKGLPLL